MDSQPSATPALSHSEAARWLKQVGGRAFRNRREPNGPQGWVAVVALPSGAGRAAEMILGTGPSLAAATSAVRESWDRRWSQVAPRHD